MATRKTTAKRAAAPAAKKAASPAKKTAAKKASSTAAGASVKCSYGDGKPATARGMGNAPVCAQHADEAREAGYNVNEL